jgi:hypothetical protein
VAARPLRDEGEDEEQQAEGGHELGEHVRSARAVRRGDADRRQAEHRVGDHGARHAARDLDRDVRAWLVATKVGLPLERVTVWTGRDA